VTRSLAARRSSMTEAFSRQLTAARRTSVKVSQVARRSSLMMSAMFRRRPTVVVRRGEGMLAKILTPPPKRRPSLLHATVYLSWEQISVGPDGYTLGFSLPSDDDKAHAFVPARHVGSRPCARGALVTYSLKDMPSGCEKDTSLLQSLVAAWHAQRPDGSEGRVGSEARANGTGYSVAPWSWQLVLAWTVHVLVLGGVCFLLVHIFTITKADRDRQMLAASIEQSSWRDAMLAGVALSLLQSLVVVDGIKVLVLAFTTPPWLEANFGKTRTRCCVKPLRRLHKVIEIFS